MFEKKTSSLGTLNDCEQGWVFSFLRGSSWEELFASLDEDETPPNWLIEWSQSWKTEDVFTINDIDPYIGEYCIITDGVAKEVWAAIHQGDDTVTFKPIPATNGKPDPATLCSFFLQELESIGDYPFIGDFTMGSPKWLPRERMEDFLRRRMKELGKQKMHGLNLEEWLDREYGNL